MNQRHCRNAVVPERLLMSITVEEGKFWPEKKKATQKHDL